MIVKDGAWYGWPNCYFDSTQNKLVLAPEYGGGGGKCGTCDKDEPPLVAFPANWAPNDLKLYKGAQFPKSYVGGAGLLRRFRVFAGEPLQRPRKFGSRRHYCFSHEGYAGECDRIVTEIAKVFGAHPGVVAWQIDSEYGCRDTVEALAEPEIFLSALSARVVVDALVPKPEIVGLRRPILRDGQPLCAQPQRPRTEKPVETNKKTDRLGLDVQMVRVVFD
jgi:hypothetical protein